VTVASFVGQAISTHPHWVTITTLSVLQPYPGATMSRAAQRVVGTVLGSLVAVVITMTIHSPIALALVMVPLSVAAYADAVLGSFDRRREPDVDARIAASRSAAGVALGEAETSLERLLAEPRHDASAAARALELVTYVRRTASAVTAIDTYASAGLSRASTSTIPESVRAYVGDVLARSVGPRSATEDAANEEPELPSDFDPHLGAALRRLLRHASLLLGVVKREI
jgi:uncharacterized membrane protein YccC